MEAFAKNRNGNRKAQRQRWTTHNLSNSRNRGHRRLRVKEFNRISCEEDSELNPLNQKRRLRREISPVPVAQAVSFSVEKQFIQLAKAWKKETAMFSTVYDKITNNNYMLIIGMGITYKDRITKLILEDLKKGAEFWHYALKSITNQNPVPKGMVNNLNIVREKWLKWGEDQQMI